MESIKFPDGVLSKLKELDSYLSKVDQSDCRLLNWALQPSMLALVQHKFMEHLHKDVRLAVASCLSEITRITTPRAPYNDDVLRKVLQMIVKSYHRLQDVKGPTFGKRAKILETMTRVRPFAIMIDLKCNDTILQMFQ